MYAGQDGAGTGQGRGGTCAPLSPTVEGLNNPDLDYSQLGLASSQLGVRHLDQSLGCNPVVVAYRLFKRDMPGSRESECHIMTPNTNITAPL